MSQEYDFIDGEYEPTSDFDAFDDNDNYCGYCSCYVRNIKTHTCGWERRQKLTLTEEHLIERDLL